MEKTSKSWVSMALWGGLTLFVMLVLGLVMVPQFIRLDPMRPSLEAAMSQRFGMSVMIDGNLRLSLVPKPTLIVENVRFDGPIYRGSIGSMTFSIPISEVVHYSQVSIPERLTINRANLIFKGPMSDAGMAFLSSPQKIANTLVFRGATFSDGKYTLSNIYGILRPADRANIFNGSFVFNRESYKASLLRNQSRFHLDLDNTHQVLDLSMDFSIRDDQILGDGEIKLTSPQFGKFMQTLGYDYFKHQMYQNTFAIKTRFSLNRHNIDLSPLSFASPKLTGNGMIRIPRNSSTDMEIIELSLKTGDLSQLIPNEKSFDSELLKLLSNRQIMLDGNGLFTYKNMNFKKFVLKSKTEENNIIRIDQLLIEGDTMNIGMAGRISSIDNQLNMDRMNLAFRIFYPSEVITLPKTVSGIKLPREMSGQCLLNGTYKNWICDPMLIVLPNVNATGSLSYTTTDNVPKYSLFIESPKLDVSDFVTADVSGLRDTLTYLPSVFTFNWSLGFKTPEFTYDGTTLLSLSGMLDITPKSVKISNDLPITYKSQDQTTTISGAIEKDKNSWNFVDFQMNKTQMKLSNQVWTTVKMPLSGSYFMDKIGTLIASFNGPMSYPSINASFINPDFTFGFERNTNAKNMTFTITLADAAVAAKILYPDFSTTFLPNNLNVSLSGEFYNAGNTAYISNAILKIGKTTFNGTIEHLMDSNGPIVANLKTETVDLDSMIDLKYRDDYQSLQFVSQNPFISALHIPNISLSISAGNLIYHGISYDSFSYALNTNKSSASQKLSITDAALGSVILDINRKNGGYDISVQANRFKVTDPILPIKTPLNVRESELTMDAKLYTFGMTAYDINRNMNGTISFDFSDGIIMGLGYDQFYQKTSSFSRANLENALTTALTTGASRFQSLSIRGTLIDGKFQTDRPFVLKSKFVTITGNMQYDSESLTLQSSMLMLGTSANPKPISVDIIKNGMRQFSIMEIQQNIDPDYTNYYFMNMGNAQN